VNFKGGQVRKIVVTSNVALDGVMQAPGGREEDLRDGFQHGGWAVPYNDSVKGRIMAEGMAQESELLFGRRTYEHFFKVWPGRTDNPFSPVLDNTQKYVASKTLKEPLPWKNSTLLQGDAADAVAKLKEQPGKDLVILGSGELVRSLMRRNLIEEFQLLIHPLVLGSGRRLFAGDGTLAKFRLVNSVPTTTGVIIATDGLAEGPREAKR
jgi:dihydrofolate reductase